MSSQQQYDQNLIDRAITALDDISTTEELCHAIWHDTHHVRNTLGEKATTKTAKAIDWNADDRLPTEHGVNLVPLETANTRTLAALGIDGTVYQLGDIVEFTTTPVSSGWGRTSSTETRTYQHQIDNLSKYHISISRNPTYSNVPKNSPSATPGNTEITLVERSNLDEYRERYTEGTDIQIPDAVNGWELTNVETVTEEDALDFMPSNMITAMTWDNGDHSQIQARWRHSYHCWRLSTPTEGVVCEENVDDYIYEIDVPQQVVLTENIIDYAVEAMRQIDPAELQSPYDLRDPSATDQPADLYSYFARVPLPEQIGDWNQIERRHNRVKWKNTNIDSPWHQFEIELSNTAKVAIRNKQVSVDNRLHDIRKVSSKLPNGDPDPRNVLPVEEYESRCRDRFDDHWFYAHAFMVDTSHTAVDDNTINTINDALPVETNINNIDHGLSTNHLDTKDKGDLSSYL